MTLDPLELDCSSVQTAFGALRGLLRLSEAELLSRIDGAKIDWSHPEIAPENQIVIQLGIDPASPPQPKAVRWFHATRAIPNARFEHGLLPTPQALPALWNTLGECARQWVSPAEWGDYQHSFSRGDRTFSGQFHQKQIVTGWEGPFAFLVRDAALGKHGRHKDFTRAPEVVEDICADFEEVHARPVCGRGHR